VIQQVRHHREIHLPLAQQIEDDARVKRPTARAHRQAIEGGKSHGGGNAAPLSQRTHARSAPEMGNDDPSIGTGPHVMGQNGGDVFIGKPMKSVALHPQSRDVTR
jgi:hypothetical protein